MIRIGKPYIETKNKKAKCKCDLFFNNNKKTLWFEVDEKYSKYLCIERGDAYLIGILHYAMEKNEDILVDIPITEDLLYNIRNILVPSLSKYAKSLNNIKITAKTAKPLMLGSSIGTGCSCGVDSFSAIYNHINSEYPGLDLTHLCINNVGAFNESYSKYGVEKVKKERYEKTDEVAQYLNLDLIKTDSNYQEVIKENHYRTHTYSSVFAIYILQKLWKVYYYASSGYDYSHFNLIDNDKHASGYYELLSLQCFSIPGLKIYSEGGEKTRLDKTSEIAEFNAAQKYLHVCLNKSTNCNICSKCKRTLATLDLLNKLDNFKEVFDIEYYKKNRLMYYKWLYKQHLKNDSMIEPVYQLLKLSKNEIKRELLLYKPFIFTKVKSYDLMKKVLPNSIKTKIKK